MLIMGIKERDTTLMPVWKALFDEEIALTNVNGALNSLYKIVGVLDKAMSEAQSDLEAA